MEKIPIYFNYVGKYPHLLDRAVNSIPSRFEIRVNNNSEPVPFTKCLNKILNEVDTPIWFFMHYDAEIMDESIFDKVIDQYLLTPNAASSTSCDITDLLVLYDTEKIKSIGGWDEKLKNSYMDLDLRQRIYDFGFSQPILYNVVNPIEINHKDASSLRKREDKENNLTNVYDITFREDYEYFYTKWGHVFTKPDFKSLWGEQMS
jgi:GT2 family glycosyltransferase